MLLNFFFFQKGVYKDFFLSCLNVSAFGLLHLVYCTLSICDYWYFNYCQFQLLVKLLITLLQYLYRLIFRYTYLGNLSFFYFYHSLEVSWNNHVFYTKSSYCLFTITFWHIQKFFNIFACCTNYVVVVTICRSYRSYKK